ncbi:MAG: hypothetical protein EBU88_07405 [Acidobacteria bacterium]|nr:hypothetical protein [Acidobacteriota bacterium]
MAEHGGYKQYVLGNAHRLVSGRPIPISEETLKLHLEELREKESRGLVYVTDLHNAPVDLVTLKVGESLVESPLPAPRLDSVAHDVFMGTTSEVRGELPPPAEFMMPVEAPVAAFSNPLSEEPEAPIPAPRGRRGR